MQFYQNYSLKKYNTFGLDVHARYFVEYTSEEELRIILQDRIVKSNKMLVIGQGSNLLFLNDFDGVIIHSGMKGIHVVEETEYEVLLEVGSAVLWDDLVAYSVSQNWYGIENLSLIPGEVGAAAIQNIGAYGVEIKDLLQKLKAVRITDGVLKSFEKDACKYAYRESIFKKELQGQYIVVSVSLKLSKKPVYTLDYHHLKDDVQKRGGMNLQNVRDTVIALRQSKLPDPRTLGNAGSFFMNPIVNLQKFKALASEYPEIPHYAVNLQQIKIPAAWLIQQSGWKGKRVGNVGVYKHQALVLVNHGGAIGQEIANLAYQIQADVHNKFGIELQPEVNFIA